MAEMADAKSLKQIYTASSKSNQSTCHQKALTCQLPILMPQV